MSQDKFDALKRQIQAANGETKAFEESFDKINKSGGDLNALFKSMRVQVKGLEAEAQGLYGTFTDITRALRDNLAEMKKSESATGQSIKAYRGLTSIVEKLKYEEQDIYSYNTKQLKTFKEQAAAKLNQLKSAAESLKTEVGITGKIDRRLQVFRNLTPEQQAILKAAQEQYKTEENALKLIEDRLALEKKVEKTVGATGAVLDTTSKLFGKLGFGHLSSELDDLNKKLKDELREEIDKTNGGAANLATSFKYVGKAISGSAKIFAEGLRDPLVILQFITAELLKGSQNMADFRKQTGMSYGSAYKLNMEMKGVAATSGDNFITSEKLNKSYSMLTQQLGVSADILGGDALISATNLEQRLGMSADQASKLTVFSRLQGENTEDILSKSTKIVGAYNKQNKTAINTRAVLDDVANTSNATYLTMGKNVEALTKAATQAQALGLSMKQVEQISESMLNFEDSIGKELEAQLLTGGNINLAKAREHALTGDMVGLTNEIQKQEGIMDAFRSKNVIAQKAAADALGISREELAGMALKQDLATMSAEKFKDAYGETTYESMKSRSASEKFADAIEKVKDILGSILQVFSPILDILAGILNIPFVPYILAGVVAVKALGFSVSGVGKAFGSMFSMGKQAITGLTGLFKKGALKSALGGLKDKLVGGFGVGSGSMVQAKSGKFYKKDSPQGKMITNLSGKAADKTKSLAGDAGGADEKKGEGVKGFLTGLGDGLASMGKQYGNIIKGAIALGIAGIAIAGGLAIAMMIIKDVDPAKMLAFTGAISMLGLTLAVMGKIGGDVIKGALALGIVAIALIPAAYAFSLLKDVDTDKIIAFSIAVPLLALAAAGLGFLVGPIAMGALALAALGVGLMAVGAGFMVLTAGQAGFELFNQLLGIMADKGVAAGSGLTATGIGMGLLGAAGFLAFPGMLLAGIALSMLLVPLALLNEIGQSDVLATLATTLATFAAAAPGLLGVAASLFGIAAGLGAVSLAGLMALPAIGGLLALSAAAPALVSLGIGGGEKTAGEAKKEGEKSSLETKLGALITAIEKGHIVNVSIDGSKIATANIKYAGQSAGVLG